MSVSCPSEPEKLHRLDITLNEAIEATKLQPLSEDSMEKQTVSKEACKLSLKAALNSKLVMDNFFLQHQPRLRT